MFKNNRAGRALSIFIIMAIFASACSLPSPNQPSTPSAQTTPGLVYTAAVKTVIAQLTSAAVSPAVEATQAPATPIPPTQVPATQAVLPPTSTIPPTPPAQPSPSATQAKPTSTLEPSATTPPTDPKLNLGDPTFQDQFKTDKNWGLAADKHSDMYVKDGHLVMKAFNPDQWDSWAITWPKTTDFYIEMTATPQECSGLDRYGLMIRTKQDGSVGYLFGFSCDGRYSFRKWDGTKTTRYVDWTKSNAIHKGHDATNRLGIKAEGDHFTLYANGIKLTDFHDKSYSSGYFGVFIAAAEIANFTTFVSELDYWEQP